jgi:hypothetical protein
VAGSSVIWVGGRSSSGGAEGGYSGQVMGQRIVGKMQPALQVGEQLEAQREGRGATGTVREWVADEESAVPGVGDELLQNADDVGVGHRVAGCGLQAAGCGLEESSCAEGHGVSEAQMGSCLM